MRIYDEAKAAHRNLFLVLQDLIDGENLAEKVDTVYGLKQVEKMLDDIRKEVAKVRKKKELFVCLLFYQEEVEKIKTQFCSAKVKVTQNVKFPHKRRNNPDMFDGLMDYMGIPEDAARTEAVRINYQGFSDLFTYRQANGLPLPKDVSMDDVYTSYELQTRKIKDLDE